MKAATARELMRSNVVTLRPTMTLADARDTFVAHTITGAPVVSEHDELLGILSQTDLVRFAFGAGIEELPEESFFVGLTMWGPEQNFSSISEKLAQRTVADVMSTNLFTVTPETSAQHLAHAMRAHKVHRVIVTEDTKVVGIVSALDLLRVLEES